MNTPLDLALELNGGGAAPCALERNWKPAGGIRCRTIRPDDLDEIVDLLTEGFRRRTRGYWVAAIRHMKEREAPTGYPRFGYALEENGKIIGVLLLIFTKMRMEDSVYVRCNVSSWYVVPERRNLAPMLVLPALRHKEVAFVNTSPALNTLRTIEAQGFQMFSSGVFVCLPAMSSGVAGARIVRIKGSTSEYCDVPPADAKMLHDHSEQGCISLVWRKAGEVSPFIFRRRLLRLRFRYGWLPCAQLVYCRSLASFVECSGPIGRYLAFRGIPAVLIHSNGPVDGLRGKFYNGKSPIYYRGPARPRLGDLAYTESALFGD